MSTPAGIIIKHMENYRFSPAEAAEVGMSPEDTGVIVFIILYLIEKEEKIGASKLEYYLLLLDRGYCNDMGILFFNWCLTKNGRIRNFKKFTEFMINRQLISSNGSAYFTLLDRGQALLNDKSAAIACNITNQSA